MQYLSQRDPRWSQVKLGASPLTVGRYGCTTTAMSMLTSYFGLCQWPDKIAKVASNYTPQGLVIWKNLKFDAMRFSQRLYGRNDKAIQESLKDPNKAVILEVDNGQHWVVALRKTILGNDYVILDPWTGKKTTACGTYHNVTGSAHFIKN